MFSLSNHGQLGGLTAGIITAAVFMFVLAFLAIVGSKTKETVDNGCVTSVGAPVNDSNRATATINCTYPEARNTLDSVIEGSEDGSDMGKILLFAIPAIAVLGLFIGLTRLA